MKCPFCLEEFDEERLTKHLVDCPLRKVNALRWFDEWNCACYF
ncbi:MAG: hypothetical protein N3F04_00615 [Candidatus Nezhaarchaeota archaeon]|nr:hypothetical protein [Candidatus Nezhaarchaeota archaeon]MCX8141278.1 hypothetical protein [Candidatus Nezhaarchaeota archaeon]MDW8049544.1 hypothetical protein [Nitrososphaerota archaeon]